MTLFPISPNDSLHHPPSTQGGANQPTPRCANCHAGRSDFCRRCFGCRHTCQCLKPDWILHDPPATRRRNPPSSADAERAHTASGRRKYNRELVLDAVRRHPGKTLRELHAMLMPTIDQRQEVSRRLWDLEKQRLVRKAGVSRCSTTGRLMSVWEGC